MPDPALQQYDPDDEEAPDTQPYLHQLPTEGVTRDGDHWGRGKLQAVPSESAKSLTPEQIAADEESPSTPVETQADSETQALGLGQAESAPEPSAFGFRDESKESKLKGRAHAGKKSHKKLFVFAGIGGGFTILGVLAVAFFIIGLLKIPNFAQHITELEFARVTRTALRNAEQVTAEKAAVDAADNSLRGQIASTYQNVRDNTWGKFDSYRPQKVIDNLRTSGTLEYNYNTGILGRKTLSGVTFDGTFHPIDSGGFFGKLHPIANFTNDVAVARDFGTALNVSLREETPLIIRGIVENNIRKELGISLYAWVIGRYQGKTQAAADVQIQQDTYSRVDEQGAVGTSGDATLNQAEKDAAQAEKDCAADPACIEKTLNLGQTEPAAAAAAVEKGVAGGFLQKAGAFASPIVAIGLPVCIIYAGSLQKSGPVVDTRNKEAQRAYFLVASAADQQKAGFPSVNSEAVGAMNWKLGDITQSNPEILAGGGTINTATESSPQASAAGQYTIADRFLGPFKGIADQVLNLVCPIITSGPGIAGAVALGVVATALSGGSSQGLSDLISGVVSELTTQFTTVDGLKSFAFKTIRDGGIIAGATLLAKSVVASGMGSVTNGLAVGPSFDNTAHMGGNLNAQTVMQRQFYGIPLTNPETVQSDMANQQFAAAQLKTQSVYQRYFAATNADSLLTRFSTVIMGHMNRGVFSSFFSTIGKIFNPLVIIPKIFSSMNTKAVLAAGTSDTRHYGIVQWDWPASEVALINSNASYQPLENAKAFTDEATAYNVRTGGDLENDIQRDFGSCFTDTMGTLLSQQKIVRDSKGNVSATEGQCSEANLGPSNNYGGEAQSVFRWRLMHSYNDGGIDQLSQVQNVGS